MKTITIERVDAFGKKMWRTDYGDFLDFNAAIATIETTEGQPINCVRVEVGR